MYNVAACIRYNNNRTLIVKLVVKYDSIFVNFAESVGLLLGVSLSRINNITCMLRPR